MLARLDDRIVEAQARIERHSLLRGGDHQLHIDTDFKLRQSLSLLRIRREMLLYEISASTISERYAAARRRQSKRERIAKLQDAVSWLESLPQGDNTLATVIHSQHQRSMDELERLQKSD